MIEIAGDDVGATAHHRLEGLRTTLEIGEFDLHACLLVFAELLRQHCWQIAMATGAAHRDRHVRLPILGERRTCRQKQTCQQKQGTYGRRQALDPLAHDMSSLWDFEL